MRCSLASLPALCTLIVLAFTNFRLPYCYEKHGFKLAEIDFDFIKIVLMFIYTNDMIKINNNIMFEIANFKDLMGLSDLVSDLQDF